MKEITSRDDRVAFDAIVKKYQIANIWPTVEALKAFKLLQKTRPRILLELSIELSDEDFIGLEHGKRSTYVNHKCNGILCRHANKMAARVRKNQEYLNDGIDSAIDDLLESHQLGM